eukprot:1462267-Pyramimonas_sp.AAC.1
MRDGQAGAMGREDPCHVSSPTSVFGAILFWEGHGHRNLEEQTDFVLAGCAGGPQFLFRKMQQYRTARARHTPTDASGGGFGQTGA